MSRLTSGEKTRHRAWLLQWRSPLEMLNYVDDVMECAGGRSHFNQAGIQFIYDAWAAAEFAVFRKATRVRLINDEWPDFEMELGGEAQQFEITEADLPGRRRGQEYRERPKGSVDDPEEDWYKRASQVSAALCSSSARKAKKHYSGRAQLLIYLNIPVYEIYQKEIEGCFGDATAPAKDQFESVWVLWKARAYHVWKNGLHVR